MPPEAVQRQEDAQPATQAVNSMESYQELKHFLLSRTRTCGMLLTLYVLLVLDDQSAAWCALGAVGSYFYTFWLCHDIDRIRVTDTFPVVYANSMRPGIARSLARIAAGLQQQAQPRLLVRLARLPWTTPHCAVSQVLACCTTV